MDKELIFYIVFGLIYLLSRAGRKKKQKQAQQPPPPAQPQKRSTPVPPITSSSKGAPQEEQPEVPMSFEDILRELTGEGKKTVEKPVQVPDPEPDPEPVTPWEPQTLEQPVEEIIPDYTFSNQDKNTSDASDLWSQYQRTEKGQTGYRKTIHEEMEDEKKTFKFSPYLEADNENPLTRDIREMLEDKEDIKKAVILSEILQRKF